MSKSYRLQFTLPGLPPTTNRQMNWGHWAQRKKDRELWKSLVRFAVAGHRPKSPLTSAKITLIRKSSSSPDFDGLVSSFKPILDGLREAGVIIDDKFSVIGAPTYLWQKCQKGKGEIEIIVESGDGAP